MNSIQSYFERNNEIYHSPRVVLCAVALVCLATFFLLVRWPHFPSVDLPNHIARFYVAANPESLLSDYYSYQFVFNGNVAVDALWMLFGRFVSEPERFTNVVMAFSVANFVVACVVLSRIVHGRWSIWPLASILVAFNANFFWGFMNFVFTVPFSLYVLALWFWLGNDKPLKRALILLPCSVVLFQMHILAFLIAPIVVFGIEMEKLWGAWRRQMPLRFPEVVLSGAPFAVPLFVYMILKLLSPENVYGNGSEFGSLIIRTMAFFLSTFDIVTAGLSNRLNLMLQLLGPVLLVSIVLMGILGKSDHRLEFVEGARGALLALGSVILIIPMKVDGVAVLHVRYPFMLWALLIIFTQWKNVNYGKVMSIVLVLGLFFCVRFVLINSHFSDYQKEISGLSEVLDHLEPGARLLSVTAGDEANRILWYQVPNRAVSQSDSFVPTIFSGTHGLRVKESWLDISAPVWGTRTASVTFRSRTVDRRKYTKQKPRYWANWQSDFTHVLVIGEIGNWQLCRYNLQIVVQTGKFALYRTPGKRIEWHKRCRDELQ